MELRSRSLPMAPAATTEETMKKTVKVTFCSIISPQSTLATMAKISEVSELMRMRTSSTTPATGTRYHRPLADRALLPSTRGSAISTTSRARPRVSTSSAPMATRSRQRVENLRM